MSGVLDEILARLDALPDDKRQAIVKDALAITARYRVPPNPGPQTQALLCQADELFYGGAAGGGKSWLLAFMAIYESERSILFRREYPQIRGLVDEVAGILGTREGYNAQDKIWRFPHGGVLEFGSVQHEDDKEKYQGRAHDFKGFDEITAFSESQYRFLIAWNRSANPNIRCRVVATGNPPWTPEGQWVRRYWGPWLDRSHPRPAKPGELRWFTTIDGEDCEVDGRGPHLIDGREVYARSRTFIKAKLEDTPQLIASGYASKLDGMEEPMRTMMREGSFDVGLRDADWQLIPTAWIDAAMQRWTDKPPENIAMTAIAVDCAGGGTDSAVLAARYGGWYAPLDSWQGPETADPFATVGRIVTRRRDNCPVVVDMGGGYGGGVAAALRDNGVTVAPYNGANSSTARARDSNLQFVNKRAEAYWRFREELDPTQDGGSAICLPPDTELRSDLAAPTWELTTRGIKIEAKDDIKKRLGRSPDKGDAVVIALSEGTIAATRQARRSHITPGRGRIPEVTIGYSHMKGR